MEKIEENSEGAPEERVLFQEGQTCSNKKKKHFYMTAVVLFYDTKKHMFSWKIYISYLYLSIYIWTEWLTGQWSHNWEWSHHVTLVKNNISHVSTLFSYRSQHKHRQLGCFTPCYSRGFPAEDSDLPKLTKITLRSKSCAENSQPPDDHKHARSLREVCSLGHSSGDCKRGFIEISLFVLFHVKAPL